MKWRRTCNALNDMANYYSIGSFSYVLSFLLACDNIDTHVCKLPPTYIRRRNHSYIRTYIQAYKQAYLHIHSFYAYIHLGNLPSFLRGGRCVKQYDCSAELQCQMLSSVEMPLFSAVVFALVDVYVYLFLCICMKCSLQEQNERITKHTQRHSLSFRHVLHNTKRELTLSADREFLNSFNVRMKKEMERDAPKEALSS